MQTIRVNNDISLYYFLLILALSFGLQAQSQLIDYPRESMELQFEQNGGKNASGMAYNPDLGLYYAVIAGNSAYPLEVFDEDGKNVYQTNAGTDMRGIWWNKKSKSIEGNGYDDIGFVALKIDEKGFPSLGNKTLLAGSHFNSANACGAYDGKKTVYYYDEGKIREVSLVSGEETGSIDLGFSESMKDQINSTSLLYTGQKKYELGLYNSIDNVLYLYDAKSGNQTGLVQFPKDSIEITRFMLGYANDQVFLYDVDRRTWVGYRIFE